MDANLFREGFIYFYENKTHGKKDYDNPSINQDFISSRPVYILKQRQNPFDTFTINVLLITSSRHRAGIPINIDGMTFGKILPYSIYSVHTKYLTKFMGVVSDDIMEEVSNAVQYYMFGSEIKPNYLIEYEKNMEFVNKLTLKEKSVHEFIEKRILFKANYFAIFDELFHCYTQFTKDMECYTRANDFSRILTQQLKSYGKVEIRTENQIKKFYGIGLNGNTHKIVNDELRNQIISDAKKDINKDALPATNDDLEPLISSDSLRIYKKFDIIQKVSFYLKDTSKLKEAGIDEKDLYIVKRMISNDIDRKKESVFKRIIEDKTYTELNNIEMYVLYACEDHEINQLLGDRYRSRGGAKYIRKQLVNYIHRYLD